MIDTLNCFTPAFSVSEQPQLTIERGNLNLRTGQEVSSGFLWNNGLRSVHGKKAKYREDGIRIAIVARKQKVPPLLYISINPGILIHGHNFYSVTFPEMVKSLDIANIVLMKIGITTNLLHCRLARMDIFKNIELDYDCNYYLPVLRMMSPKYMSSKGVLSYDNSYQIANQSVQYNYYNKLSQIEAKHKYVPVPISINSANIGRLEIRYMKHLVIKGRFGFETVGELVKRKSFSMLIDIYERELTNNFFRFHNLADQVVPINTDIALLRGIKEKYPKIAPELFFTHSRIMDDNPFTINDWMSLLRSADVSETTIKERRRQMMDVIKMGLELKQEPLHLSELTRELYEKLTA